MSLSVLKKKTLNGNPRLAPVSGSNNGTFGFSLNGTRRGNYQHKDPSLLPKSFICQSIGTVSGTCTNDINVVKPTVMNTKGMLAKKLRGFGPLNNPDCNVCTGPLSVNWVKRSSTYDHTQGNYIKNIVSVNGNKFDASGCNLFKSYNGILGVLDLEGFNAINKLPQGSNPSSNLSPAEMQLLIENKSIMPNESMCAYYSNKNNLNKVPITKNKCSTAKPGITTVDAGDYIKRKLLINKHIPWQQQKTLCNEPQPNPAITESCGKTSSNDLWNNNIKPSDQVYYDSKTNEWKFFSNSKSGYKFNNKSDLKAAVHLWVKNENEAYKIYGDINTWDVSSITDMSYLFSIFDTRQQFSQFFFSLLNSGMTGEQIQKELLKYAFNFNSNISNWDVSNVTNMEGMFLLASSFNQNIGGWDVSKVTNMNGIFFGAISFNSNISSWDVSKVTNMNAMFYLAISFDQDIGQWKVDNVTNMQTMFSQASSFNQDIGGWDVSKVTNMSNMFDRATAFNQDIAQWKVDNVTNMDSMFNGASSFNQDIGGWDVSKVTNMRNMFSDASSFNQDISDWKVGNVTDMSYMFDEAIAFNQNIGGWDVGNVTDMSYMFYKASSFDQNIGGWNVDKVTNMEGMFAGATAFNQDISDWNVDNVTEMENMFADTGLSDTNKLNIAIGEYFSQNESFIEYYSDWFYVFNTKQELINAIEEWKNDRETALSKYGDINTWNVSNITDMSQLFFFYPTFNDNISNWDVSNVTNMKWMFNGVVLFNQDIGGWDVSKVTDMNSMFLDTVYFNKNIGGWDVSNVTDMSFMFARALSFNQDISDWNVSKVTNMDNMFAGTSLSGTNKCAISNGEYFRANKSFIDNWKNDFEQYCS